ncbi:MAG: hypothetical protein KJ941_12645 [Bacteroidetes bacterium]|nr:hypothetical protein [Bacteroidota bacterium]
MKFRFLTKTVQNKKFDYSPMYYDERKERLELKKREFERIQKGDISDQERKEILRRNMQASWTRSKNTSKQKQSANYRVILLIIIILAVGYFFLDGMDEVDNVVKKLW